MTTAIPSCPGCGGTSFEKGWLDDVGKASVRWFRGDLKIGSFGVTKRAFVDRMYVTGRRCESCGLLSIFAVDR